MEMLKGKIPDTIFNKLLNLDVVSLESLLTTNKKSFEEQGLTYHQIDILLDVVAELVISSKLQTALEIPNWERIRTGCKNIDEILKGGIPIHGINEIYGCSGVGKTQFCLQLAIMAQLPIEFGGYNKDVLYICTEDMFPSKRLNELITLYPKKLLSREYEQKFQDHIYVEHIVDFEQLRICLCVRLQRLLQIANIGLIIIDSIAGIFRSYNEHIKYTSRKEEFTSIAETLYNLADKHKISIVCTNQVTDNTFTGNTEPCLGLAWSNYVTSRFGISRIDMTQARNFEVIFSPDLQPTACEFYINPDGIDSLVNYT